MSDITVTLSNICHMPTIYSCTSTVDKEWDMVISCVCAFVCLCVRALKGKRLETSSKE